MIAIVNRPCGHPLISFPDPDDDRLTTALTVLREAALQPQAAVDTVPDDACYGHSECLPCRAAAQAYMDASAREHLLRVCQAHGVSAFSANALYAALRADGQHPRNALASVLVVIHEGWTPRPVPSVPLEELDPRRAGR